MGLAGFLGGPALARAWGELHSLSRTSGLIERLASVLDLPRPSPRLISLVRYNSWLVVTPFPLVTGTSAIVLVMNDDDGGGGGEDEDDDDDEER